MMLRDLSLPVLLCMYIGGYALSMPSSVFQLDKKNYNGHVIIIQEEGLPVNVYCQYTYNQIWKINGTVYALSRIPAHYKLSYLGLEFTANASLNGTQFQCFGQKTDGFLTVEESPITVLHIKPVGSVLLGNDDGALPSYYGHFIITQRVGGYITIPCQFRESKIWRINDVIYGLSNLPPHYKLHYVGLQIDKVEIMHNNTEIICLAAVGNNLEVIESAHVKLHVFLGSDGNTSTTTPPSSDQNKIEFDYKNIVFQRNTKTIAWINTYPDCNRSVSYSVRAKTCGGIPIPDDKNDPEVTTLKTITIPSDDFVFKNANNDLIRIYKQITTVSSQCPDVEFPPLIVYINPKETTDPIVVPPGGTACLPLQGDVVLTATWPTHPGGSEYCSCPLCIGQHCNLRKCSCFKTQQISFNNVDIQNNTDIGLSICWYNLTSEMTNTKVYLYSESRDHCQSEEVGYGEPSNVMVYHTFEMASVIIVGGTPDLFLKVNVPDDGYNGIVCFNATTYDWQPVLKYNVNILDVTEEILYKFTLAAATASPCIQLPPLLLGECTPLNITVTAYNEAGFSESTSLWPDKDSPGERCDCYKEKLVLNVTQIDVDAPKVEFEITCSEFYPSQTGLIVQLVSLDYPGYIENVTRSCVRQQKVEFERLQKNTKYTLQIKPQYLENCIVNNSTEFFTSEFTTLEVIEISVGSALGGLVILCAIIIIVCVIACIVKKQNYTCACCRKGNYDLHTE